MNGRTKWWIFNGSEMIGIFALTLLIIVSIALKPLGSSLYHHFEAVDTTGLALSSRNFKHLQDTEAVFDTQATLGFFKDTYQTFEFNPNTITEDSLELFGFSTELIERFFKFRNALGRFSSKEQVLRLYGLPAILKERLDSSLIFAPVNADVTTTTIESRSSTRSFTSKSPGTWKKSKRRVLKIELNSADTTELQAIYGIGTKLAKRIVKFREALGGFVRKEQLFDVYGVDSSALDMSYTELFVDTTLVEQIAINEITSDQLGQHPYLSYKQAEVICKYREVHGSYSNSQEILKTKVVNEKQLQQLSGYLYFE